MVVMTYDKSAQEWKTVLREMKEHIHANGKARQALAKLLKAGCDDRAILANLYLYCGGSPEMSRLAKQDFTRQKKRILTLARELVEVSKEIEAVSELVLDLGFVCHFTPDTKSLEVYSGFLDRLGTTVLRKLASRRTSGREQHLVFLCRGVETVTGREHYTELADLVNATSQAYDPKCKTIHDAESLRKLISRHGFFDPGLPESLEEFKQPSG